MSSAGRRAQLPAAGHVTLNGKHQPAPLNTKLWCERLSLWLGKATVDRDPFLWFLPKDSGFLHLRHLRQQVDAGRWAAFSRLWLFCTTCGAAGFQETRRLRFDPERAPVVRERRLGVAGVCYLGFVAALHEAAFVEWPFGRLSDGL